MWINPETQQTYANHSEIRAAYPHMSLPAELSDEFIASMGFVEIAPRRWPAIPKAIQLRAGAGAGDHDDVGQLFVGMSSLIREQELLVSGA